VTSRDRQALSAKRYSAYLNRFYERIKAEKGWDEVIIAKARKILWIIY
jgi:hypothetical protein